MGVVVVVVGWRSPWRFLKYNLRHLEEVAVSVAEHCVPPVLAGALWPAGDMVWAHDKATDCWWPGEKLDPLNMPAGTHSCTQACVLP